MERKGLTVAATRRRVRCRRDLSDAQYRQRGSVLCGATKRKRPWRSPRVSREEAAMISEADAVVVGAGALGLSTAFHLARFGVRRVALIDRFAPGSQTSARAAGLFKLVQADETRTRLARLSVQKVTRFMEETGVLLEVVRSGSLLVSRTPEHAALVREAARQSQAWGVDVQLVDGDEAHCLMPLLEGQGIRAACHTPGDVYIDEPSSLLQAYLEACRRQGVPHSRYTRHRYPGERGSGRRRGHLRRR